MKKIILSSVVCASMMFAATDYKYEVTPMIGGVYTEGNTGLERNYMDAGLSFGWNQFDSFIDQVELGFLNSVEKVKYENTTADTNVTRIFANLIKDYPLSSALSLYTLVGGGAELYDTENAKGNVTDGVFVNYGAGLKYKIAERAALKFDLRHAVSIQRDGDHLANNNLLYTLGLAIPFGEVEKAAPVVPVVVEEVVEKVVEIQDTDGDGVADNLDKCPNTIAGAVVDANGCELDDDNDGVVNRLDKCPNTIEGAQVNEVGCMTLVDLQINFALDSARISDQYNSRLEAFANMMKNNKMLNATLKAYTDSTGSAVYNQKLSERRAAAAVNALIGLGVDSSRMTSVGYGEKDPIATNKTKEGRAANRRVTAEVNK